MDFTLQKCTTYSIEMIQSDAQYLVERGYVRPNQKIYTLIPYLVHRDHSSFLKELELNEYLLRDCIADLIPRQNHYND